jgi:hypothetical protein
VTQPVKPMSKETMGSWIVHHGRKLAMDANGSAEYSIIDEASKAADLLSRMSATNDDTLSSIEVEALGRTARLNPRIELPALLAVLEKHKLIERRDGDVHVIGVTSRGTLSHAADIFMEAGPTTNEKAIIDLAEKTSEAPRKKNEIAEYISDAHKISTKDTKELLNRSEEIGFVDAAGTDDDRLLFNGNLFRRDNVDKTAKVLSSLSPAEQRMMLEFAEKLKIEGCINSVTAETVLGTGLFEKLKAAGVYDLNTVSNDRGEYVYVTAPDAFHKFVDPMVDDSFDMAKSLVAALTYGMTERSQGTGRIQSIEALLKKLLRGDTVGPATAIGHDYHVLEQNRVVKIIPEKHLFRMKLLKYDVGQMALQVLTTGNTNQGSLEIPNVPMGTYRGPEESRMIVRRRQSQPSKSSMQNILGAIRGGRSL